MARPSGATGAPPSIQRTNIAWEAATSAKPTEEGGMGGVIFVKVGGATHVLKAAQGSAAPTLFGERVLQGIGGARTTESEPIRQGTPEFQRIMARLTAFKGQVDAGNDERLKATWAEKFPFFAGAQYLLVQKDMTVGGGREFGRVYKQTPQDILGNDELLRRIGLSMAADALIGNADRWEQMNTGNAFVDAANRVGAIDTEAILSEYQRGRGGDDEKWANAQQYGAALAQGHVGHRQGVQPIGAPASSPEDVIFKFDRWFDLRFKDAFTRPARMGEHKVQVGEAEVNWQQIKATIKAGLDDGLARVRTAVTGQHYKDLKHDFDAMANEYGADPNFDRTAFKIKAAHMRAATSGADRNQARQHAEEWAEVLVGDWRPTMRLRLQQIGHIPVAEVPVAPAALTKFDKFKRAPAKLLNLTPFGSAAKQQSNRLKEQLRTGEIRAEDVNLEDLAIDPHSRDKLAYEQAYKAFKEQLEARVAGLNDLADQAGELSAQVAAADYKAKLAKRKLKVIRGAAAAANIEGLAHGYSQLVFQWRHGLNASREERYVQEYEAELSRLHGELKDAHGRFMTAAGLRGG